MTDIMAEEPIRIRDCACPGSPHPDGDFVRLRPKLTSAGGAAASYVLFAGGDTPAVRNGELFDVLLVAGIGWWNLVTEAPPVGKRPPEKRPVSINEAAIREQITWGTGGKVLFNPVMLLYADAIFEKEDAEPEGDEDAAPLATDESSDSGPTGDSTSASPPSSAPHPRPSRSSSPASTATAP